MNATHTFESNTGLLDRSVETTRTEPAPTPTTYDEPPKGGGRKWAVLGFVAVTAVVGVGIVAANSDDSSEQAPVEQGDSGRSHRLIQESIDDALAARSAGETEFTTSQRMIEQSIDDALAARSAGETEFTTSQRMIEDSIDAALAKQQAEEQLQEGWETRQFQVPAPVVESGGLRETGLGQRLTPGPGDSVTGPTCHLDGYC